MTIDFINEKKIEDLSSKVRAILGVPEDFLTDEIISSPAFAIKADRYINKAIKEYEELDENLLSVAYIYYVSYLLCIGMEARLPKQMEDVNTKTILQNIDWASKALDLLGTCNDIIDDAIEEVEDIQYGDSFAVLTASSEYPNTSI
jgi:hypothetical protein